MTSLRGPAHGAWAKQTAATETAPTAAPISAGTLMRGMTITLLLAAAVMVGAGAWAASTVHASIERSHAVDRAAVTIAKARWALADAGRPQVAAAAPEDVWADLDTVVSDAGLTRLQVRDADAAVALLRRAIDGDASAGRQAAGYLQDLDSAIGKIRAAVEEEEAATLRQVLSVLGLAFLVGFGSVLLAALWVRRELFRRFQTMSRTARRIVDGSPERLDERVRDPLGAVASAFNAGINRQRALVAELAAENARATLARQIADGLEMATSVSALFDVVGIALSRVCPETPAEFLVVEADGSGLTTPASTDEARCPVDDAEECIALRRGTLQWFPDSGAVNACPKLLDRAFPARSALCVPATFLGQSLGVIHIAACETGVTGPATATKLDDLDVPLVTDLASMTANRLGTMRAFAREELNARTDPLTGLPNRREFERKTRQLRSGVLAMADLDHFKYVNDTFGHDAGDEALMLFADVLRSATRGSRDLLARWGGEEFALVMPDAGAQEAVDVVGRIQETLARACLTRTPAFTCSWGLAQIRGSVSETVRQADQALYSAKESGRDCWVLADPLPELQVKGEAERTL